MVINVIRTQHLVFHGVAFNTVSPTAKVHMLWHLKMSKKLMFLKDGAFKNKDIFCTVYDFSGKADISKGCWNPKRKIEDNHAFFRDKLHKLLCILQLFKIVVPLFLFFLSFFLFFFFFLVSIQ